MRTLLLNATPFVYLNDNGRLTKTTGGRAPTITHYDWRIHRPSGPSAIQINVVANSAQPNGYTLSGYSLSYLKAQHIVGGSIVYYNPAPPPITFSVTYDETALLTLLENDLQPGAIYNRDSVPLRFTFAAAGAAATSYATWAASGFNNIYEGSFWAYEAYLDARGLFVTNAEKNACRSVNIDRSSTLSIPSTNYGQMTFEPPGNPVIVTGYRWYWNDGSGSTDGSATQAHTFANNTTGVQVVGLDNYGREVGGGPILVGGGFQSNQFRVGPLRLAPRAVFEVQMEDGETSAVLDGTDSFDLDGSIVTYLWYVGPVGFIYPLFSGTFQGTGPTLNYQFPDEGEYEVVLEVRDSPIVGGSYCSHFSRQTINVEGGDSISILSDHDGVAYAALPNSGDVEVREYKNGAASGVLKYILEGHSNPSIYQHAGTGDIYLAALRKDEGTFKIYRSDDYAGSFEFMANAPFPESTHKGWRGCDMHDGGHGLASIQKETSPAEVWFSRSWDGTAWTAPTLAGTLPNGVKSFDIYQEEDGDRLVIVMGNVHRYSDELGDAGTWFFL